MASGRFRALRREPRVVDEHAKEVERLGVKDKDLAAKTGGRLAHSAGW